MGVALVIGPDQAGERLDRYLAGAMPGLSRSQAQRLIEEGRVQVAGRQAKANLALKNGDQISVELPAPVPTSAQPEDIPVPVLYEDADLLVVNKPAGMVVHPAAGHSSGT